MSLISVSSIHLILAAFRLSIWLFKNLPLSHFHSYFLNNNQYRSFVFAIISIESRNLAWHTRAYVRSFNQFFSRNQQRNIHSSFVTCNNVQLNSSERPLWYHRHGCCINRWIDWVKPISIICELCEIIRRPQCTVCRQCKISSCVSWPQSTSLTTLRHSSCSYLNLWLRRGQACISDSYNPSIGRRLICWEPVSRVASFCKGYQHSIQHSLNFFSEDCSSIFLAPFSEMHDRFSVADNHFHNQNVYLFKANNIFELRDHYTEMRFSLYAN